MQKGDWTWTSDYWGKTGISPPGSAAWHEVTVDLDDLTATGNPGYTVDHIEIKALDGTEIGTGGFLIDALRFERLEKYGTASDATSQASYGKRTLTLVDKGLTSTTAAGYAASGILANRKDPVVTAKVTVPGRGQPGYRPPQRATLTSLRDGLNSAQFQIVSARHLVTVEGGYTVTLDLAAAHTSTGLSDATQAATPDLEGILTEWRRRLQGEQVNTLRSTYT
jgi:phage protein D